ncbi:hypothetical protein JMN32_20095 [Fulvivirga sp. 29W222]|uniref:Uncharacterized protein n=1 Tax=Fulvivirga marina TaxID=2494733 RepID=A0A937KDM9_9BACT|nr:hypothetical protein [Fulvivirga marina]MBL6448624.1 hypothetical protein [Fulvivirga marina]
MELNKKTRLTIVGRKELLEVCIYEINTVAGTDFKLVEYDDSEISIGVVESANCTPDQIFKFGSIYQEWRLLPSEKWIVPKGGST